jgi:hypothetical protein
MRGPDDLMEHLGRQVGDQVRVGDPARREPADRCDVPPVEGLERRRIGRAPGDSGDL